METDDVTCVSRMSLWCFFSVVISIIPATYFLSYDIDCVVRKVSLKSKAINQFRT